MNILIEQYPQYSISGVTVEYFGMVFNRFLVDKDVFEFWKIRTDTMEFNDWPEAIKMDHFMSECWY